MELPYDQVVQAHTYIAAPLERVWQALTQPGEQAMWHVAPPLLWGRAQWERLAWGYDEIPIISGEVVVWDPARTFAHRIELTRLDEPASTVHWRLTAYEEVVLVEIEHFLSAESMETQALVTDGWPLLLARLKTWLETGEPMPWPEWEEEWMGE